MHSARNLALSLEGRPGRGRKVLRTAVSAILIAATFGFAIPRIASYRSVWASIQMMTWPHTLLIAAAAAASMASYWITIRAVLPRLKLRQAATVNLGSNAVANTLPAGGALAMGVSWAMLSSWGLSTGDFVLYTLVTGIWNVFTLLGMPVLALLVMTTATRPDAVLIIAAATGLALLVAMVTGLGLLLRSQAFALRAGRALQRLLNVASGWHAGHTRQCRRVAVQLPRPGRCPARRARLADHRRHSGQLPHLVARAAGLPSRHWPVPGPGALANLPRGLRFHPAAHRPAHHPGRTGGHRTWPGRHPGRERRLRGQRPVTPAVLLYRAVTYLPPSPSAPSPAAHGGSPPRSPAPACTAPPGNPQRHDSTGPLHRTSSPNETASQPSAPAHTG